MDDEEVHELLAQYIFERSQGRDEWRLDKIQARLDGRGFAIAETEAVRVSQNIRTLSIAPVIGEAIGRTSREESVSSLFH